MEALERNERVAWTTDVIVAELVWVLSARKTYNLPRERIRELLLPLVELPGLRIPNKRVYQRAFAVYVDTRTDYIDAFHVALLEHRGAAELLSFDQHFDRVPSVRRIEP